MAYSQPFPLAGPQVQKVQAPSYGPDLSVRLICPECRDPNPEIAEEFGSGDLVCRNCGLVLGDRIVDTRSEWRVSKRVAFAWCAADSRDSRLLPTTRATTRLVLVRPQIL
jgi:hypothetical protein